MSPQNKIKIGKVVYQVSDNIFNIPTELNKAPDAMFAEFLGTKFVNLVEIGVTKDGQGKVEYTFDGTKIKNPEYPGGSSHEYVTGFERFVVTFTPE